jgi:hypothetical protein
MDLGLRVGPCAVADPPFLQSERSQRG